jgi:ubiquinone/menaquinone biosynthesis C-methylase UbiE
MRLSADGSSEKIAVALQALRRCLKAGVDSAAPFPETEVRAGYEEWAGTYDQPGNPLIFLEEKITRPLLAQLPRGDVLDVAAGTGRHTRQLSRLGHRVTALDLSRQMLRLLDGASGINVIVGDIMALPLKDAAFDLGLCSLALTHVKTLRTPLCEIARVVRPGGVVILSDIHPIIAVLGGQAYYRDSAGNTRFIRNRVWWPSDYLRAFRGAGLEVIDCWEPLLGPSSGIFHFMDNPPPIEDAMGRLAFGDLPGAIVWKLHRPAAS